MNPVNFTRDPLVGLIATPELRSNLFAILDAFPREVQEVRCRLLAGQIEGRAFGSPTSCGCLLGTLAFASGRKFARGSDMYLFLESFRPAHDIMGEAESLFLEINLGDTPETNEHSALALRLVEEWMQQRGLQASLSLDFEVTP